MNSPANEESTNKILLPVSDFVDKLRLPRALHVLTTLKNPTIVLFRVVEVPQRTNPLDPDLWKDEISEAEGFLDRTAFWLKEEGYMVETKVVTARNTAEGIITEANTEGYTVVLMMKRRIRRGWPRMFHRSTSEEVIRYANPLVLTFLAEQQWGEQKAK